MTPEVIQSQADTLSIWAEQWSRIERSGAGETAFLLARVAKLMRGDLKSDPIKLFGGVDKTILEEELPPPTVESEIRTD